MAKVKGSYWCGYLEAGTKSAPVVRDDRMGTRNSATVYLFNFTKDRIVEYRRDIVDSKLRELTPEEETAFKRDLLAAFEVARNHFVPRAAVVRRQAPAPPREPLPDLDTDDDDEIDLTAEAFDADDSEPPPFD